MRTYKLICLTIACAALAFWLCVPIHTIKFKEVRLDPPFDAQGGAFGKNLTNIEIESDSSERPTASQLEILEDGKPLGPAHSEHAQVFTQGNGAYSHWQNYLYFSASDNSNPSSNAKQYVLRFPLPPRLIAHYAALAIGVFAGTCFFVLLLIDSGFFGRLLLVLAQLGLVLLTVEGVSALILAKTLFQQQQIVRSLYMLAFEKGHEQEKLPAGESFYYKRHHYLNYVLNAALPYLGQQQFNAEYLIRRGEALATEKGNKKRILVLGGSTVFDEGIANEHDTWVWQLEDAIRKDTKAPYEVINAGVGGYTLLENFIHYVTMLRQLDPDVVMLYTGINDVHPRFFGDLKSDYSNYRKVWNPNTFTVEPPIPALKFLQSYRYYYLKNSLEPLQKIGIGGVTAYASPAPSTWADSLKRNGPEIYRDHLEDFVRLLKAQGKQVVLIPQHYFPKSNQDKVYAQGVTQHNEAGRDLARKHSTFFVGDILKPGLFGADDTRDSCHFTTQGTAKMAQTVFAYLKANKLLS